MQSLWAQRIADLNGELIHGYNIEIASAGNIEQPLDNMHRGGAPIHLDPPHIGALELHEIEVASVACPGVPPAQVHSLPALVPVDELVGGLAVDGGRAPRKW